MDPASCLPQNTDIGPILAVVGINGWRCSICSTTFSRSFSIEHHMITSHHPLPQELTVPRPLNTDSSSSEVAFTDPGAGQAQKGTDAGVVNLSKDGASQETNHQGQDREASMEILQASPTGVHHEVSQKTIPSSGTVALNLQKTTTGSLSLDGSCSVSQEPHGSFASPAGGDVRDRPAIVIKQEPSDEAFQSESADKKQNQYLQSTEKEFSSKIQQEHLGQSTEPGQGLQTSQNSSASSPLSQKNNIPIRQDSLMWCKPSKRQICKRRICSCGEVFDTKQEFRHHRRIVHCRLNQKVFICSICNAHYGYKRGLNRHLAIKGSVAVYCNDCPRRFHDQVSLDVHRAACHAGTRTELMTSTDGEAHRVQNENRSSQPFSRASSSDIDSSGPLMYPWECSRCKKQFVDKKAFRGHLVQCGILTFQDGFRTFQCNLCSASFRWLVSYHKHYVNDHKLSSVMQATENPAATDPSLLENSPAPSPCPSVTSELNSAMAEVDLNKLNASAAGITAGGNPSALAADLNSMHSLSSENQSEQGTTDGWSLRSSNPHSLSSETGSSERVKDADQVVLSDTEDSITIDSSSDDEGDDLEDEWEMISDFDKSSSEHGGSKYPQPGPYGMQYSMEYGHPSPPHHPGDPGIPPPFPPPPPPPFPHFPHFPPPHHHYRGFGHRGRFGRGRGPRGPWAMWMAPRFGHGPGSFFEPDGATSKEATQPDEKQTASSETPSNTATSASENDSTTEQIPPAGLSGQDQEPGYDEHQETSSTSSFGQDEDPSSSFPFPGTDQWIAWAGTFKEGKCARKTMKKAFWSILASCRQGKTFFFCPDCMQAFSEESELDAHSKEKHVPSTSHYMCFICQQLFANPLEYNKHIRQHSETFGHMQARGGRGGRGWMGMGCGKERGGPPFFKHHRGHHKQKQERNMGGDEKEVDGSNGTNAEEEYKECPLCPKKFRINSRENFFERHVNSHLGVDFFKYKCEAENCGKTFLEKAKYVAHVATHSSPQSYSCDVCGKTYQNKTSLTRHQRVHTGERPYKCPECNESFTENRYLVRHRSVHTGQAAFQCEVCGTGFTLKASLLTHMRKKHQGLRGFTCSSCLQVFGSTNQLIRHRNTCKAQPGDEVKADIGESDNDKTDTGELDSEAAVKQEPPAANSMDLDS